MTADPQLYLRIPNEGKRQTEYATAALEGLAALHPNNNDYGCFKIRDILREIASQCPTVFANGTLFRKLIESEKFKLLITLLKSKEGFTPKPIDLMSTIMWNMPQALSAVDKSPLWYKHLPTELKQDREDLALATIFSSQLATVKEAALKSLVKHMRSCCHGLFSNPATVGKLLSINSANKEHVVMTVLSNFGDTIAWDQELVHVALQRFPATNFFLPPSFRNEKMMTAKHVVPLLLKRLVSVDDVISICPTFLDKISALEYVFEQDDARPITTQIVKKMSSTLPWNQDLVGLARDVCYTDDYRSNLADKYIEKMYKGRGCQRHLPLGMILSYVLADKIDEWPDFLNHCSCDLAKDDSRMLEALDFMELMVRSSELSEELQDWLLGLVAPIKLYFEERESFQTLLKCITVAARDGQEPLSLLPKDDETNVALKRKIAEFLVGSSSTSKLAEMKQDALQVVFCIVTLPSEYVNEMSEPSHVQEYEAPFRSDEATFFAGWCSDALAELDEKYNGNPNNRKRTTHHNNNEDEDDDEESDEEED